MVKIGPEDVHRLLVEVDGYNKEGWAAWYEDRGITYEAMDMLFMAVKSSVVEMLLRGTRPDRLAFEEFLTVLATGWMLHEQYGRGK